jgi:8-oxo-dGTP pyrophosphatase MutT (NUDIX family)
LNTEYQNRWITHSSTEKYDNAWINVTEFQVTNPSGKPGIYGKIHFKNRAIGIIPIDDDGNTWLVGQWRYPLNAWSWEIPEGGAPEGADVLEAAKRELKEETGMTASTWQMIQYMHLSNSVSDEEGFVFLAEGLEHGAHDREDTEADMVVKKMPFVQAHQMVLDGKITDSLSVLAILKLASLRSAK